MKKSIKSQLLGIFVTLDLKSEFQELNVSLEKILIVK